MIEDDMRQSHIGRHHLNGEVVQGDSGAAVWECGQCQERVMLCCYGIECISCLAVIKRHNCEDAKAAAQARDELEAKRAKKRR